jgi:hypothetical protein
MTRDQILEAIRQAAADLGRVPGARAFHSTSGISRTDLWNAGFARYGDAVEAAGLKPNALQGALDSAEMLARLAFLTRRLGRFPSISDLKTARAADPRMPSYEAYFRLAGRSYARLPELLLAHCRTTSEFSDVADLLKAALPSAEPSERRPATTPTRVTGYVYLAKHGQDFKIGRSNDVARRRRETALLLPQELKHVHIIETDDPEGIERYWHERFSDRRVRGEWFRLTREDVAAFKRRRYQ